MPPTCAARHAARIRALDDADTLLPEQIEAGKFVGVWRRSGGDWRLAINISNSDGARPRPS